MSKATKGKYGYSRVVPLSYEQAIGRVTATLAERGFGILTEIDVKATLKKKLDRDFTKYVILGACNPSFAVQALSAEIDIGLLFPCNVTVYQRPSDGETVVAGLDPEILGTLTGRPEVESIAREAGALVVAALEAV